MKIFGIALSETTVAAMVIVFGAVVHATAQYKMARDKKEEFAFLDWIILIPIAAFSGLLAGLIASVYFGQIEFIFAASGVGSFLGIRGLNKVSEIVFAAISKQVNK